MEIETFPAWEISGLSHGFSTRSAAPLEGIEAEMLESFTARGFPMHDRVQAEQPHGNCVGVVHEPLKTWMPGVDALVTVLRQVPLVIRVADCGPVFFYDPVQRAIGLAHSGRRGTEGNIVSETIACLQKTFGSKPEDLWVELGACIRPPHYEIDFAAEIGRQAKSLGVRHYHDAGVCTASHLDRYYSYRAEKGKTGRMWAVLMLK